MAAEVAFASIILLSSYACHPLGLSFSNVLPWQRSSAHLLDHSFDGLTGPVSKWPEHADMPLWCVAVPVYLLRSGTLSKTLCLHPFNLSETIHNHQALAAQADDNVR